MNKSENAECTKVFKLVEHFLAIITDKEWVTLLHLLQEHGHNWLVHASYIASIHLPQQQRAACRTPCPYNPLLPPLSMPLKLKTWLNGDN